MTPDSDPVDWGVNRIAIRILSPAEIVRGNVGARILNSGLVTVACCTVMALEPRFVIVSDRCPLLPTTTVPKSRLDALTDKTESIELVGA